MLEVLVVRDVGHPWDGREGFDILDVTASTEDELAQFVARAEAKFWHPWLIGWCAETGLPSGVLYKPCDIRVPWSEDPVNPHKGCVRSQADS